MNSDSRFAARIWKALDQFGPLVAMVVVWLLFAVVGRKTTFATWENAQSILLQTAVVGIASLGMTMIIISGGIDLSAGSLIALVSIIVAMVLRAMLEGEHAAVDSWQADWAAVAAALAGVALAGTIGAAIGSMVVGRIGRVTAIIIAGLAGLLTWRYGVDYRAALALAAVLAAVAWFLDRRFHALLPLSPFIVTLGMWGALRGAAKGLADNSAIYAPETRLNEFMRLPAAKIDPSLLARPWQWWSPGVWIFLALAALIAAVLRYTQFGRHVYAIGSNEQTARLCGVRVERTKLKIYAFAALLTGAAGVMQYSFVTMGDPTTAAGYELRVIAAVVIGGASLSGGVGGVAGSVAGALLISIIDNGCTMMQLEVWTQEILTGVIIVAAVALDKLRRRKEC